MQSTKFLFLICAATLLRLPAAFAQTTPYPTMLPIGQYLMQEKDEIALARSAAPKAISDEADVSVLTKTGYVTVAHGTNGFLCIVQRGWATDSTSPDFWNPKLRSPNCFNAAATRTILPIYLMKTRLVLEGKSKLEVIHTTTAAIDSKELPAIAPGAMCYMMSRLQYLNEQDKDWHPHLMFFAAGDAAKSWGANLAGSPLMAINDPEERMTVFMMMAGHWSDGTPAPAMEH